MAKPNSFQGYRFRWHQLAKAFFEEDGIDYEGFVYSDIDACNQCEMKILRAFMIECFIDTSENTLQYVGLDREQILQVAASESGLISFEYAKSAERIILEAILTRSLSHWKLPADGYRVAVQSVRFLQKGNAVELLEPYRPDEVPYPGS